MAYTLDEIADELDVAGFTDYAEVLRALDHRTRQVDIVFNGAPGPDSGRFIEVEDMAGRSVRVGDWVQRDDGYWALRLTIASSEEAT
jgi:hypothetical protein